MELGRYSPHAIIIVQLPYNIESQNGAMTRHTGLETIRASTIVLCQDGVHYRRCYGENQFHACHSFHEEYIVTTRLYGMHAGHFRHHSNYSFPAQ